MMWVGGRWQRLTTKGLALVLVLAPCLVSAQEPPESPPADSSAPPPDDSSDPTPSEVVSPERLERIRKAIASNPDSRIDLDLTFFLRVVEETPTFADYLAKAPKGWAEITPILPPPSGGIGRGPSPAFQTVSGGGFDLLDVFRSIGRARREREARQIRARIDRELELIESDAPPQEGLVEPEAEPESGEEEEQGER